jgi:hypothetical protein
MTGTTLTIANINRSTDDGATWAAWKSAPRDDIGSGIRHWHSARYDSVSQRVYFMAGDTGSSAGIYRVNAGGTDIESLPLSGPVNSQ